MEIKTFKGGYDNNFTYIIHNNKKAAIIDPAVPAQEIFDYVKDKELEIQFVVIMHSHFDHLVDLEKYRKLAIPIYGHESSKVMLDKKLKDNEIISFDNFKFRVLHVPGHRYDCLCLLIENNLFTSDTLFVEGCGRVDLPGSEPEVMFETLERLKQLPDNTTIYPGHDYGSTATSTLGKEKKNNRFLKMDKEEFLKDRT